MTDLANFLVEQGCFESKHSGESLGNHLINTYRVLHAIGVREPVALAGGLHSIYGTNAFKRMTVSDRATILLRFGAEVERLVFLFHRLERPKALEAVPDDGGEVKDRLTGDSILVSRQDVEDLRLIEAANLLEQSGNLSAYPKICATIERLLLMAD